MTPDRFREVERLYHAARARPDDQRARFLAEACPADAALQAEVESMLASERAAAGFMSTPAVDSGMLSPAASFVGQKLGPYAIQSPLGAGGMGEVYRARDSKLGRDVAIKILPRIFTHDPDRLARFEREARLLASLNHPNIGAIYGLEEVDGIPALVLELVEGDTLAERLARGGRAVSGSSKPRDPRGSGLPLTEALTIARQIADALEAAHEKGIVHRDLKPANIKITPAGVVKVLDFGLAKFGAGRAGGTGGAGVHDLTNSPTMMSGTREGVILGTAAYMSPEQAQGQTADARSDIWAFGVVLYEMLTGRSAFGGDTAVEVLSNVLKTDPDWTALPASTPALIRSLLRRCLQKDPRQRLRDIADARFQIEEALNEPAAPLAVATPVSARKGRERLLWAAALAVAVVVTAAGTVLSIRRPLVEPSEVRLELNTPPTTDPASLAVSQDGRQIVFAATSEQKSRLWVRALDAASARELAGTDDASRPFWSPDSRSVGFFADGQLKRIDIGSGFVQVLTAALGGGGAWNQEGTILFSRHPDSPLLRISADGGEPTDVIKVSLQTNVLESPQFLPDGRHFLFHAQGTAPGVYIGQLRSSEPPKRILDALAATYASSGHLLFVRQGTLFAQAFDPTRLELVGDPKAVTERIVVSSDGGAAALSASAAGPIVYRAGPSALQSQFVWFDRSGKALEVVPGSDGGSFDSSLSPDGHRLAITLSVGGAPTDIWLLDLNRGVRSRFTFDKAFDLTPVWSPDGKRIAFSSNRLGTFDPYVKPAAGPGDEELLETGDAGPPSDWSPDGKFILRTRQRSQGNDDIWALPLSGDRKAFPVVETTFNESNGQFSPDGKWIAYQSNESGQLEIYVQPFPGPGQKTRISSDGGVQVRWRHDGQELFYLAPDNRLMAARIRIDSTSVDVGTPVPLFATQVGGVPQNNYARNYSVSRDGQRFLVDTLKEVTLPITVLLNWKPKPYSPQ